MEEFKVAYLIVWSGLLGAPFVAIVTFLVIRWWFPGAQSAMAIGSALTLLAIFGAAVFHVSFIEPLANFISIAIAYLAFCYLAVSCWRIPNKIIRILALLAAAVPISLGYVLGTIGMFGVMFIIADYTGPPKHTEILDAGLICRVTQWGMAATDSGYTVHLYQHWNTTPFLERELTKIVVNETDSRTHPSSASCTDVLASFTRSRNF